MQIGPAEQELSVGLWLSGAEWTTGYGLPWWLGGWGRASTGVLTNVPLSTTNKRDILNSTEIDSVRIDPALRNRFRVSSVGLDWISE